MDKLPTWVVFLIWVVTGAFQWGVFSQRMNNLDHELDDVRSQLNAVQVELMTHHDYGH